MIFRRVSVGSSITKTPDSFSRFIWRKTSSYLDERAESKGMEVSQLVNEMLRRDIALIETVK